MKKYSFYFLPMIILALNSLTSCGSPICCCKYATNTYNTYDSLVADFVKQSNVKGNFSFFVLDMEETLGDKFVSSPIYTLSGIDDCVPCTERCKKNKRPHFSWRLYYVLFRYDFNKHQRKSRLNRSLK